MKFDATDTTVYTVPDLVLRIALLTEFVRRQVDAFIQHGLRHVYKGCGAMILR